MADVHHILFHLPTAKYVYSLMYLLSWKLEQEMEKIEVRLHAFSSSFKHRVERTLSLQFNETDPVDIDYDAKCCGASVLLTSGGMHYTLICFYFIFHANSDLLQISHILNVGVRGVLLNMTALRFVCCVNFVFCHLESAHMTH